LVTERRRQPGRRSEERAAGGPFADAFAALSDGIVIVDGYGAILSANPAASRLLGEAAIVGRTFDELGTVRAATPVQGAGGSTIRRASFPREERTGVLEIASTPIGNRESPSGAIHVLRDVTAQAELLRLKEEFLLQVAHELRTPIASLSASVELVHQDALSMSREELAAMVSTIRRSAYRLERLVDNLLDAGSIEAGTFQVRPAPTSLRRALEESLHFAGLLCDTKHQRIEVDLGAAHDWVVADAHRTSQVFANVLGNASAYAPEGSTVTVSATERDGFVRITVHDEGPGIPPEEQPLIFERFFRSGEVRDAGGGLGLGLAICRAIVQAQGGEIGVESAPGSGTSVHFTVPKAREITAQAEDPS
jgi:signal transduction histidine kinase